jgi:hypothetical protein
MNQPELTNLVWQHGTWRCGRHPDGPARVRLVVFHQVDRVIRRAVAEGDVATNAEHFLRMVVEIRARHIKSISEGLDCR